MEEVSTWVYTALITAALATVMFFATRSSDWYVLLWLECALLAPKSVQTLT